MQKIPADLLYMSNEVQQHYQPIKAPLSSLGLFNILAQWLQNTTTLPLAHMTVNDFSRLSLVKLASQTAASQKHQDRCQDDLVLCEIKHETNTNLQNMLEQLCFEVGETFYNMTNDFDKAVDDYNKAFQALTQELTRYINAWGKLGDTFFQYVLSHFFCI